MSQTTNVELAYSLNHLIVGCTSINRGGHSSFVFFFSQFKFPILDAGGEDWADTVLTAMPLTLRTQCRGGDRFQCHEVSEGSEGVRESFSEEGTVDWILKNKFTK